MTKELEALAKLDRLEAGKKELKTELKKLYYYKRLILIHLSVKSLLNPA